MTKSDLIEKLVTHYKSLPPGGVEKAVNAILDAMTDELVRGGRIEVRGFGAFSVRQRRARQGRNPKTGAPVAVPPSASLSSRPASISPREWMTAA
jgi:integration host factor subunit beta